MKWKITVLVFLLAAVLVIIECGQNVYSNSSGAPVGYAGSPADLNKTCANTGCHTGSAVTPVSGWITSTIPSGGYTPGQTYTITATATFNGKTKFGFQVSPQDALGNKMGTLVNTNSQTQVQSSGKYVTHTTAGNTNPNFKTWNFNWTAPASGSGPLTFYGAFNCTNSSNTSSGDLIFTSTLATTEDSTNGLDCGVIRIQYPDLYVCSTSFSPIVTIENYGTTVLDSVLINYQVDLNPPSTFWYVGTLNTFTSATVTLPSITTTAGAHNFTAFTSTPNNNADIVAANDSKTNAFTCILTTSAMPFMEGFEATTFPPVGWKTINPDAGLTWARTTAAHTTGVAAAFINNYSYTGGIGQHDQLVTPLVDLTTQSPPSLYFQVAYNLFTNPLNSPNYSDTLTVLISTDCGVTWTEIYKKFGAALTTKTPNFQTSAFTPTNSQWRLETVSLVPYSSCSNAIFKFMNTCGFENRLYLDDIQISGPMSVHFDPYELNAGLYPNPSNGNFTVEYSLTGNSDVSVKIFDVQGKMVREINESEKAAGAHLDRYDVSNLPEGLYFVKIKAGQYSASKKLLISK